LEKGKDMQEYKLIVKFAKKDMDEDLTELSKFGWALVGPVQYSIAIDTAEELSQYTATLERSHQAPDEDCASCRHWKRWYVSKPNGYCRCKAPSVITDGPDAGSDVWPDKAEDEWCGEYESGIEGE
jgi:hypothetical protein